MVFSDALSSIADTRTRQYGRLLNGAFGRRKVAVVRQEVNRIVPACVGPAGLAAALLVSGCMVTTKRDVKSGRMLQSGGWPMGS